jgi:hypothetical protein
MTNGLCCVCLGRSTTMASLRQTIGRNSMARPGRYLIKASKTGIRLEGPRFRWARTRGGEKGSHLSNVLEFGYSSRGVNINGDILVILGRDG